MKRGNWYRFLHVLFGLGWDETGEKVQFSHVFYLACGQTRRVKTPFFTRFYTGEKKTCEKRHATPYINPFIVFQFSSRSNIFIDVCPENTYIDFTVMGKQYLAFEGRIRDVAFFGVNTVWKPFKTLLRVEKFWRDAIEINSRFGIY